VSDLIASIKTSKLPIICICNDKYKTSLKSLKNHCIEINWSKPTKVQAAARLRGIAQAERLAMNQVQAHSIA
jgi:replication factor C subunit 1